MKGIVLAGGTGSRLHPVTLGPSKQLLPVYDKPMIYYPLSVLMLAGIRDIQIITTPHDLPQFERLLEDGSKLGMSFRYAVQQNPSGVADALRIGTDHVGNDAVGLILGDNVFHGARFGSLLCGLARDLTGCVLFGYPVSDPERYGVGEVDAHGRLISLEEKPKHPRSNLAITGLYLYDNQACTIAHSLQPSARGELEITDLNRVYMDRGQARLVQLGRGHAWLDTGTHDSLLEASHYVNILQSRQGVAIACIEELAWRLGYITTDSLLSLAMTMGNSPYGRYIQGVAKA